MKIKMEEKESVSAFLEIMGKIQNRFILHDFRRINEKQQHTKETTEVEESFWVL